MVLILHLHQNRQQLVTQSHPLLNLSFCELKSECDANLASKGERSNLMVLFGYVVGLYLQRTP